MSVFNDELDLAVLEEALDRYSDSIPRAELETLKQLIQSWKNQDDRAAQTLYDFVSQSDAIDEAYDHALLALRRQYSSQPKAKSLILTLDSPANITGLNDVADRLLQRLDVVLHPSILPIQPIANSIWDNIDRLAIMAAGGAFLGGAIVQILGGGSIQLIGALIGAITGAVSGWYVTPRRSQP
jgi:hypothetical protein